MSSATREPIYRGRFAPSPTGPLHFGSLVAALGSWLDARCRGGAWLLRIEDLDRPRVVPGSDIDILRTLEAFGFDWDGPVLYQSGRTDAYSDAVEQLRRSGLLFPCGCSRTDLRSTGKPGAEGPVYPGTCRTGLPPGRRARTLRVRTTGAPVAVRDRIQGTLRQNVEREVGDFVVRRADGLHAYQLAVVVDDAHQGVTHVVRGADLVLSTPRQVFLQRAMKLATPDYAHLPVAIDGNGRKLSKSDAAAPIDASEPLPAMLQAWSFLQQAPFPESPANLCEFREFACANWTVSRIPAERERGIPPRP